MGTFSDRIGRDRHRDIGCGNAARFSDNGIDAASGPACLDFALIRYRANSGCKSLDRYGRRDIRDPYTHLSGRR